MIVQLLAALLFLVRKELLVDVFGEVLEKIRLRLHVEFTKVRQTQLEEDLHVRWDDETDVREDLAQRFDLLLHQENGFLLVKLFGEEISLERPTNQIGPILVENVDVREILERTALLNGRLLVVRRGSAPQRPVDLQFAQFLEVTLIAVGEKVAEVLEDDDDVVIGEIVRDLSVLIRFEKKFEDDVRIGLVHGFDELRIDVRIIEPGEDRLELLVAEDFREETRRVRWHRCRLSGRRMRMVRWRG